jgi:hypothetical protein
LEDTVNIKDAKKVLKPGTRVFWNDPDEGLCSREIDVKGVKWTGAGTVLLEDDLGEVEAFTNELQLI